MIIQLLVLLIVIGLIFWAVNTLAPAMKIPAVVVTIINVLLAVVTVLYILRIFGLWSGALP